MEFSESTISTIMTQEDLSVLSDICNELTRKYEGIAGMAMTGSLVQKLKIPNPTSIESLTPIQTAYRYIENPDRRRIYPSCTSDLDVWLCLKDTDSKTYDQIQNEMNERAIEVIGWLANNLDEHGSESWVQKKNDFLKYYKSLDLYSKNWKNLNTNTTPWEAVTIKNELQQKITQYMSTFVKRINFNFTKKLPGDFLELRAFPESTYNLRVEEVKVGNHIDRTPFPFILTRLLDLNRNAIVLSSGTGESTPRIYPFNLDGQEPGKPIEEFILES